MGSTKYVLQMSNMMYRAHPMFMYNRGIVWEKNIFAKKNFMIKIKNNNNNNNTSLQYRAI